MIRTAALLLVAALGCGGERGLSSTGPSCDHDRDGWESEACGGADCDDLHASVSPSSLDVGAGGEWVFESPLEPGTLVLPRIAIDSVDAVHVVVWSATNGALLHFARRAETWERDVADGGTEVYGAYGYRYGYGYGGGWQSTERAEAVVVDGEGVVHVLFADAAGALRHVRSDGSSWTSEIVHPGPADSPSLGVGAGGAIEAAWTDWSNGLLRFATFEEGEWTLAPALSGAARGRLLTDPREAGRAHFVYVLAGEVHDAVRRDGVWTDEILRGLGTKTDCNAALDDRGSAYVVCGDGSGSTTFGSNRTGTWRFETLQPFAIGTPVLAVGSGADGVPVAHVAFQNDDSRAILHGSNAGGEWTFETIRDDESWNGVELALDSAGEAHLVGVWATGRVRYARFLHPDGVDQDCDGGEG